MEQGQLQQVVLVCQRRRVSERVHEQNGIRASAACVAAERFMGCGFLRITEASVVL
jgi:hypothetical protein